MPVGGRGGAKVRAPIQQRRHNQKSPLSSRYNFTPAPPQLQRKKSKVSSEQNFSPPQPSPSTKHFKDYPPPTQLFQTTLPRESHSSQSQPLMTPLQSSQPQPETPRRKSNSNPEDAVSPRRGSPTPPLQNSSGHSNHFSNRVDNVEAYRDDSDDEVIDDTAQFDPDLEDSRLEALNALLSVPNRHKIRGITTLSPIEPQPAKTTWFGRDSSKLTRKITRIFTSKFNGPYYTWFCVPRNRQERYFLEFAKTHHWDLVFSGLVQQHFESICQTRMKDMVSTCRRTRVRPKWINSTLWTVMCTYWDTSEAQKRSQTASQARKYDRKGLGEHKHFTGQKSYAQVQQEMEVEVGRPVSVGEVFIRIHTRPDGTLVDRKAAKVAKTYEQNVKAKLSEFQSEDGNRELTTEEDNEIFLQSTEKDSRGTPYGVGSLANALVTGKQNHAASSSSFQSFQDQLVATQKLLEEQAAKNARLEADQQTKFKQFSMMEKFLKLNPRYVDFLSNEAAATHTDQATTEVFGTSDP